MTAFDKIDAS